MERRSSRLRSVLMLLAMVAALVAMQETGSQAQPSPCNPRFQNCG
jgi:hypothetical protein